MVESYTSHFSRFRGAVPGRLHFAAHSHHPWPDVTRDAHLAAWDLAAAHVDEKWGPVFSELLPAVQGLVARELHLPDPRSLAFAPNTHELVVRLLSCLAPRPRIVTTDAEFHSFERQVARLEEEGLVDVTRVPSEPFATFGERFVAAVRERPTQLAFFSHVFFNSGFVVPDLAGLVSALPAEPLVVVDGYHGFCAVPTDLGPLAARAFYLGGGYKYAMAGEGACFLHVPLGREWRPRDTGWFAAFGALEAKQAGRVPYGPEGMAFFGATFDPSGLFRMRASLQWREAVGLTTVKVRAHAHALQQRFVEGLERLPGCPVRPDSLVVPLTDGRRGQFLTFRTAHARELTQALAGRHVVTDARDDRLRFGFGVAQDAADVDALLAAVATLPVTGA